MPHATNPTHDGSTGRQLMASVYVRVVVIEAAIIAALWLFGHSFR